MSYSTVKNVTPIDMLPELEDLEGGSIRTGGKSHNPPVSGGFYATGPENFPGAQMIPKTEIERMSRHVRNGHILHPDSGMVPYMESEMIQQRPSQLPLNTKMTNLYNGIPYGGAPEMVSEQDQGKALGPSGPTCLEVADHIANCPICSKFYNNDKTIYIIAIVILAIVCILLLKRVLDV